MVLLEKGLTESNTIRKEILSCRVKLSVVACTLGFIYYYTDTFSFIVSQYLVLFLIIVLDFMGFSALL